MSASPPLDPRTLIPHGQDAVLLDEVTGAGDDWLEARLAVRPGTAFSDRCGNLPGWVGPEIMAQAISALSGYRSMRTAGKPASVGLLLGVRGYEVVAGGFRRGEELRVEVMRSSEEEDGRAVFDGRIVRDGRVVASGKLTVYQPADDSFLAEGCVQ